MTVNKIIITGGATRIGAAIAKSLADYETAITIHYNKSKTNALKLKKELESLGSEVYLLKADLNNFNQTQKLLKVAYKKMKGLNCLINNASLFENDNLQNFTNKSFEQHLNINLKAPAILIQNFKKLLKNSGGNIINIIDQRVWNLTPHFISYTLSKSALWTLTQTLALSLSPNIRVNAIGPGPTLKSTIQSDKQFKDQYTRMPLQVPTSLEEISSFIELIIHSPSMTGQMIALDSGQHLGWAQSNNNNYKED